MGIGRRDFLKLFGTTLLAMVSQPISNAIYTDEDLYINRKFGISFQKPQGWYFNNIQDMGEIAKGQVLDLIDEELARKTISNIDLPFVSLSKEPISPNDSTFCPGINVYLEVKSKNAPVRQESDALKKLVENIPEPFRSIKKDILANSTILRKFRIQRETTSLYISNCPASQYISSFIFEHSQLVKPVKVRMNTLIIIQGDFWYTFRMYDSPYTKPEDEFDYTQFMNSIWVV